MAAWESLAVSLLAEVAEVVGGVVADDAVTGEGWGARGVETGVGCPFPVDAVEGVDALVAAGHFVVDEDGSEGLDFALVDGGGDWRWEGGLVVGERGLTDGGDGGGGGCDLGGAGSAWKSGGSGGGSRDGDDGGGGGSADGLGGGAGSLASWATAPVAWWAGWLGVVTRCWGARVSAVVAFGVSTLLASVRGWNWSWSRGLVESEEWIVGDWGDSLGDGDLSGSLSYGDGRLQVWLAWQKRRLGREKKNLRLG